MTRCRDCRHWMPRKGELGKCERWVPRIHTNGTLTMNYYHGSQRACKKNFEEKSYGHDEVRGAQGHDDLR